LLYSGLDKPFYYVILSSVGEGRKLESGLEDTFVALNLLKKQIFEKTKCIEVYLMGHMGEAIEFVSIANR